MAYNATYTSEDVSDIIIDVSAKTLVQFSTLAVILGIILFMSIIALFYDYITKKNKREYEVRDYSPIKPR